MSYNADMIELALPAGSLETAISAFNADADAVYFGMKEFSARKGAANFSIEDLSKIKCYASEHSKKIYVTVNTLVDDSETEAANRILSTLDFYEPDGIIIQDLGLVQIIREHYPHLPLHGSTQLAVHTVEGVRQMQDLGFERVVLSRELTLKEIEDIREKCPDIELKVFIHGALCYGFSGLCMASCNLTGRSANRGECAQICRTWFTEEKSRRNGCFFSLEDLNAGRTLVLLNAMGIDSAKIEGRLKGNEYVCALTRYYKAILRSEDAGGLEDLVKTTFSRKSGQGYFYYKKERKSLLSGYPSHLGLECGLITDQTRNTITVKADKMLHNRDGLQYFKINSRGLDEPVKFACRITGKQNGYITLSHEEKDDVRGKKIYKITSSVQNEKKPNLNLPLFRKPVDIKFTIGQDKISAEALGVSRSLDVTLSEAKKIYDILTQVSSVFTQSDTSLYTLKKLHIDNTSGLSCPFLPLSALKTLRREFYLALDATKRPVPDISISMECTKHFILPDRKRLSDDLPWSLDIKEIDGKKYINLPPVTFNEEELFRKAGKIIEENPDVIVGLNNIAHIRLAKAYPHARYFADIYLYLSNKWAARLIQKELGDSFIGGYLWLERTSYDAPWPVEPTVTDYIAPSFISRTCFRHDAMGLPCSTCKGKEDFHIFQNDVKYTVKVRNCLTVVEKN